MMNTSLLWLILVPILLSVAMFFILGGTAKQATVWKYGYSSQKAPPAAFAGISLFLGLLITVITFFVGIGHKTHDQEVWNGQVTGKSREEVSCRHSYSCNCRERCYGSGKSRSCSTVCDTCYEHSHDVDWITHTTLGGIYIDTIDRQGTKEPPRWTASEAGQPVAKVASYTNYVKAVPESVIHFASSNLKERFAGKVPAYPLGVYDYHYIDRVLPVGVTVPNLREWNLEIGNMLRTLGPSKQVNVVIIPTNITDKDYVYAVRDAWLGGKKNDVVIIVSITEYPKINWVAVLSWTDREMFKVVLRDGLQDGMFEVKHFTQKIDFAIMKYFERKHMSDFKYLENEIDPPEWLIWLGVILNIAMVGGMIVFHRRM